MKIYLVRHGDSTPGSNDDERHSSEQGRRDTQQLANFIFPLNLHVSRLIQSNKQRAQETAAILASSIHIMEEVETSDHLDPLAHVDLIIGELYAYSKDTVLVGHMPFMGELLARLITRDENKNIVIFKTSSMACLEEIEPKQWVINWMVNPALFNK